MRIAIAGLATTHPYTDARVLSHRADLVVYDDDAARISRFLDEHPTATVAPDIEGLLDTKPDGVVLTVPTPQAAPVLAEILDRDLPCFVNKPAAATAAQLDAIDLAVSRAPHRVLSTSVLRFAPTLKDFSAEGDVLAASVIVRHDVSHWAKGHNPWQDDPCVGGGMLVTMGVHGVELLVSLLGPQVRTVSATAATLRHTTLASEDTAVISLRWADGTPATVTFLGVTEAESYEVLLHTAAGDRAIVLKGGGAEPEVALGYRGTIDAFLSMVDGAPSPVAWSQTRAVLSALVCARELSLAWQHQGKRIA